MSSIAAAKTVDVSTEIVEVEEGPEPGTLFSVTVSAEGESLDDLKKDWENYKSISRLVH